MREFIAILTRYPFHVQLLPSSLSADFEIRKLVCRVLKEVFVKAAFFSKMFSCKRIGSPVGGHSPVLHSESIDLV
jgi:hypothetical protein